jgi:hypothetical protein
VDPVQDRVVTVGPPQVVALVQVEAPAPVVLVLDQVVTVGPAQVVALVQVEAPTPVVLVLDQVVTVDPPQVEAPPVVLVLDQAVTVDPLQVEAPAPVVLVLDQAVTVDPPQVEAPAPVILVPVLVVMMMIGLVRKISTSVLLTIRSQFLLSKEKMTAWCRLIVRVSWIDLKCHPNR